MDSSTSGDRERLRRFYETSSDYKKLLDAHGRTYLQPYVDTVNKYAPAKSKILDMGCGNGLSSLMLSEYGHWVVGSDISSFFLADSAHLQNDRLRYHVCDALALPFADGSFDAVCSNELIEHVTDAGGTLLEMIRMLKKGGILAITGPNLCSPIWAVMDFVNMALGKKRQRYVGGNQNAGVEMGGQKSYSIAKKTIFLKGGVYLQETRSGKNFDRRRFRQRVLCQSY